MRLQAKKSLGQHFLNSKNVLGQIIGAAKIRPGETILEIGPGTGVLTAALIKAGAKVTAVEKDNRSIDLLKENFSQEIKDGRLVLVGGDILDIQSYPLHMSGKSYAIPATFSIVANIPYYITGAILEKFLEHGPRPTRMVLLVQKEVARRILGSLPGGEGKESVLSISVKAFGTPKIVAIVPPGAFTPPPTVDSAILSIDNISAERFGTDGLIEEAKSDMVNEASLAKSKQISHFFQIVKAGFAHKRKFLIRNLEDVTDLIDLKDAWTKLGLNEKARAEEISLDQWIKIATTIQTESKND